MHLLVIFALVSSTFAGRQGYSFPSPAQSLQHGGGGFSGHKGGFGGGCANGQVLHVDGSCVTPIVNRNIFHYLAPKIHAKQGPAPIIPQPKVDYNIVFVRTPEFPDVQEPIVVPPPQQKTLVYVLTETDEVEGQQVIEVPSAPQSPEVYYVNYDEGDNPTLPGGIDLRSALASADQQKGQVIEGGVGAGIHGGSGLAGGVRFDDDDSDEDFTGGFNGGSLLGGGSHVGTPSKAYGAP